jgi:chromosome segregation ATPase
MNSRYILLAFSSVIFLLGPFKIQAEEMNPDFSTGELKQDQFSHVKSQIGGLIEENKRLEIKNSLLQEELINLSNQINEHKAAVAALQGGMGLSSTNDESPEKAEKLKNDILMMRTKNNLLKTQLSNLEEKINARKLQMTDLTYQKSALEIDQKMKSFQIKDYQKKAGLDLETIQKDLENMLDEEREVLNKMSRLKEDKTTFAQRIEELKKENQDLEEKAIELEKKKEFKARENTILKDKKYLEEQLSSRALDVRMEDKLKLKQKIERMEKEYNDLDQKVENTLISKTKNEEITKNVIRIDKENQELRDRIEALKSKVSGLK